MVQTRIAETNEGIQGEFDVKMFNLMQRRMRDRGWMETKGLIKSGITEGHALEIGPGPGYLGLEWLKNTRDTSLTGVDISPEMLKTAAKNSREYGFSDRVRYIQGNSMELPFNKETFDAVFSNGSLHEWEYPERVFDEIHRVLKPGGRFFISDLRRDMKGFLFRFLDLTTRPKEMRSGLASSVRASYTKKELEEILSRTALAPGVVAQNPLGLTLSGRKADPS